VHSFVSLVSRTGLPEQPVSNHVWKGEKLVQENSSFKISSMVVPSQLLPEPLQKSHHVCYGTILLYKGPYLLHWRIYMGEKGFVAGAQVVEPRFAIRRLEKAVLGTASMTGKEHGTLVAGARQGVTFGKTEALLLGRAGKIGERNDLHIAEAMARLDEVVTGVDVTVMFHGQPTPTRFVENAQPRRRSQPDGQRNIKYLHAHTSNIVPNPLVKDRV
jgi:hypothetical protein